MADEERVPVLVVGGGLVGLATTLFLAEQGVRTLLVDRHPGASIQGRARGINQRTMEIYRALGLETAIREAGKPFEDDWGVARCETLAGEWHWLFDDDAPRIWPALSPGEFCQADQNAVEPILISAAREKGAEHRFNTELVSIVTDDNGATAVIRDRATGVEETVLADYVVAADGHRSPIREQLGIHRTGPGVVQHSVSIVFRADLSEFVPRPALFWIIVNEKVGGGLVTTAEPNRWGMSVGYDPAAGQSPADFTVERCVADVRNAIGRDDLEVEIEDVAAWEQAIGLADQYRSGRVFLAGDAAHVWPPAGAMGANTGVQDGYNLAWKIAGVVKGWAGEGLLDTYHTERHTLAVELSDLVVNRQMQRNSAEIEDDTTDDQLWTLGQRYWSSAVLGAKHDSVFGDTLGKTAEPGLRAPHLWVERDGEQISTHDLFGRGFVLFTGTDGTGWSEAAAAVSERLSCPVKAFRIGSAEAGADLVDVDKVWEQHYPLGAGGAALIRPDGYVAWLSQTGDQPAAALSGALERVLQTR
ncbi:FAD-dependent monooxygenase [Amycolatopsis halotolerans]|uniref:FAD-dependent monooxygenase n=1 Tax=Amycolatopsis halotolerans TaxID=330083 RepID=A0ABV7Q8Y2_9PSEU